MAERSREWGELLRGRDASGAYGVQMFGLRREQARLAELAPVVRLLAGEPRSGPWLPGMAALLTELGMHEEAQARLEPLRREGLGRLRESLWVASLTYLADAYAVLPGDDLAIERLRAARALCAGRTRWSGTSSPSWAPSTATWVCSRRQSASGTPRPRISRTRSPRTARWAPPPGSRTHCTSTRACCTCATGRATASARPSWRSRRGGWRGRTGSTRWRPGWSGRVPSASAVALPDDLSPREVEVLRLVAQGMSNREIGGALHISEHTAANHIRSILRKTGSANRTEATSYAHRRGLTRYRLIRSRHAPVCDRAQLRGSARAYGRRRPADPDGQRRRGRPLAVLVPERRPAASRTASTRRRRRTS